MAAAALDRKYTLTQHLINVGCNARHFYAQAREIGELPNAPSEDIAFLERMGDQVVSVAVQIGTAIRGEPSTIPAPGEGSGASLPPVSATP